MQNSRVEEAGCQESIDLAISDKGGNVSPEDLQNLRTDFHNTETWFDREGPTHDNFYCKDDQKEDYSN